MAVAKSYSHFSKERDHSYIKPEPMFEFEDADVLKLNGNNNKAFPTSVSLSVNTPAWCKIHNAETGEEVHDDKDDRGEDTDKMPPHEYFLARETKGRTQNKVAGSFSVLEGRGRTLKGRDLSRLRNAVWEKIGFQD